MSQQSSRFHMALAVADIEASTSFYTQLFNTQPSKVREGYAKFEPEFVSVNFTLNQASNERHKDGNLSHFGIQIPDGDTLADHRQRLGDLGLQLHAEDGTTCCFALQNKFWVKDPDGNDIEFFHVLEQDVALKPEDAGANGRSALSEPVQAVATGCCA